MARTTVQPIVTTENAALRTREAAVKAAAATRSGAITAGKYAKAGAILGFCFFRTLITGDTTVEAPVKTRQRRK
jgi:hypothetical protein